MKDNYPITRIPLPPGIRLLEDVYVTMKDGVRIAMDVYLPEKEGRYPVIMAMCPYKKEAQAAGHSYAWHSEAGNLFYFVSKGYAMIYVSVRGSGKSGGVFGFLDAVEQKDSYEIVEGIAKQPWCDGNVGMFGVSYLAISQYYTAAQHPPHLKCIAPFNASTDWYRDFAYQLGGMYYRRFMSLWGVNLIHELLYPGPVEGKLPPPDLFGDWLSHHLDDSYFQGRSMINLIDKIEVPTLLILNGFLSPHARGMVREWSRIKSRDVKLLVCPGSRAFGTVQKMYWDNDKFNNYLLRWFDHWLKGVDTGIMDEPPVMIHDSGSGENRYENELPPLKRTQWTEFYLRSNPKRPSSSPQGFISLQAPAAKDEPDKYNAPRLGHASVDLSRGKPVLAYATSPLKKDVRVWGSLSATIYGSIETSNTSTWAWFVNLCDVAPDGTVMSASKGNLKACYRDVDESQSKPGHPWHPFDKVVNLKTNEIYDFLIELQPMFYTFKKGHKIQVEIMSDDPEFKIDNYGDLVPGMFPAEVSIYHDQAHPSHLLLPVVPDAPMIAPVKEPLF